MLSSSLRLYNSGATQEHVRDAPRPAPLSVSLAYLEEPNSLLWIGCNAPDSHAVRTPPETVG
jgi:hypothetical protein